MNMKQHLILALATVTILIGTILNAEEIALSSLEATKLAEKYITDKKMPKDFFVRRTSLKKAEDGEPYYQIQYAPPTVNRVKIGEEPPPRKIKYLHVSMDGKVTEFEKIFQPTRKIVREEKPNK